ncbi:MAG: 5'/3'-nucleotidase SurE [Isosphaeraceae bacterium]
MSHDSSIFLLTNDDGWDSPGLLALRQAALGLGRCRVVAPSGPQSGCGHRVTTHAPIEVKAMGEDILAVGGTPADCVRLALHTLAPKPQWILSGINAGGNLGADVHHSGTVAAVREGALHGLPGIALSQYTARGRAVDWDRAARWAREVLGQLLALSWEAGTFWNVNFPHPAAEGPDPEVVFCPLDPSPLPLDYRVEEGGFVYAGDYQKRAREPGTDVDVCFGGRIAVTLVRVAGSACSARSRPASPVPAVD